MKKSKITGFSLVEILIALIIVSLITAAMAPVITKKLKSSGITIGGGGGSGGGFDGISSCPDGLYLNIETKTCEICPAGSYCDGVNKIPCAAGTFSANRATECSECAEGYYSPEGAEQCLLNTAQNCAEKSKTENACISCNGDYALVDGNCVSSIPVYTLMNASGTNITSSGTELTKDSTHWQIKIKSSGTFSFSSLPANLIDVFIVGGGAGGRRTSSTCSGTAAAAGGGGHYNIFRDVVVSTGKTYPITIGSGGAGTKCTNNQGGTTSGFGLYSLGGRSTANHSICPFNETSCTQKYAETGTSSNQKANTGNGGQSGEYSGYSGVIIIRGKLNPKNAKDETLPSYKYMNSSGSDITNQNTTLYVDDTHWYLRFSASGTMAFTSLPNNFIDAFIVGGGAGGRRTSSDCSGTAAAAGGGGNYNILRNVSVSTTKEYPITIGSGGAGSKCSNPNGGTSSGFGAYSYGGRSTGSHSLCPFGESTCDFKYGVTGAASNQNSNTGNGGISGEYSGMNGVVIIRGLRKASTSTPSIPTYKFLNTSGSDATTGYSTLTVDNNYWYIKFNSSGSAIFNYLPTELVDVFVVGSGAGGRRASSDCSGTDAAAGGGGTYTIERDVHISSGMTYPITIGSSAAGNKCSNTGGSTSSGFGSYSRGGIGTNSYSICAFGEPTCEYKYGNNGSATNQNPNTGNGGYSGENPSMTGTIIIRGKLGAPAEAPDNIPSYRYTNSSASDITNSATTLSVTNTHWYIKFTQSGELKFDFIKNDKIDVFIVGSGAAGRRESGDCSGTSASAGGGGNYKVLNSVAVAQNTAYPIVIGAAPSGTKCTIRAGSASSAFGGSAAGGSGATSHKVCLFNGTDCTYTFGNTGSGTNQFQNTGNGGMSGENAGMNGVVIIRGTL